MPIGDNDIASGVFFSDFAVDIELEGQPNAKGHFDCPGQDAVFGEYTTARNSKYRLEMSGTAFSPMPEAESFLTIKGAAYVVTSVEPMDDGATVEIWLRKL